MMRNSWIIFILVLWLIGVCSCGCRGRNEAEFRRIDRLCDSMPEEAIRVLDSIDRSSLTERERNRYDLLSIKSRDKAYVAHTSDSLILDVIDYYAKHRSEGLYAEALYYGGRVYSDIGDLPTALELFQKSLDEIPEDNKHLRLRITVLNQTGRLLYTLRLDSAAIEYLERSLLIYPIKDKNDPGNAYTHGLIAGAYLNLKDLKKARQHINEAIRISYVLGEIDQLDLQTQLAEMLLHEGKVDSALNIVRDLPLKVDSLTLPYCLAVASEIYRSIGIPDTAYMYARKLTKLNSLGNKKIGYKVIFSEELKDYVSKDTLLKLIPEYKRTIENYLNLNEAGQAITQNSKYNYSKHVKDRQKTEKELLLYKITVWIIGGTLALIFLTILSLYFFIRYRKAEKETAIMHVLNLTDKLKEETTENENIVSPISIEDKTENYVEIKNRIFEKTQSLKDYKPESLVSPSIQGSQVYQELVEKIMEDKCIVDSEEYWPKIESLIESVSTGFNKRLDILTEERISQTERKVTLLMKCGFTTKQISILLSRGPNTISSHKRSVANKISDEKMPLETLHILILSL